MPVDVLTADDADEPDVLLIEAPDPDSLDLKICNCARCGDELLGESNLPWWKRLAKVLKERYQPMVTTRIDGRPYCKFCARLMGLRNLSRE
jgi:hypothetical protein